MTRLLTIMGSGETAPTMVKVHRELLARLGDDPTAVVLDTPYGFQENAPELATRAQEYFAESVGRRIDVAGLTRLVDADPVEVERGLSAIRGADYVFAGPGSPTYALRQWAGSSLAPLLVDKLRSGGAITFASAAALTLGVATVPVYEIYKAGDEPHWLDGLDLLAEIDLHVAVIPHYDNAEGGHHDTRFCYLGERRLRAMEAHLPDGAHVLGVDEHTGLVIDVDADTATVVGNGSVTVRVDGESVVHPTGTTIPVDALRDPRGATARVATEPATTGDRSTPGADASGGGDDAADDTSLAAVAARLGADFDRALADRDAPAATRAALELEAQLEAWSADTLTGTDRDDARSTLRSMITRLGDAAVGGVRDPRAVVGPYLDAVMSLRTAVRAERRYDLSDLLRDELAAVGVEVRDTADGPEWHLVDGAT